MRQITRVFKYFFLILYFPLWKLQVFIKRSSNIWIFGAWYGQKFSDNAMYLYKYILENEPNLKIFWITKNIRLHKELKKKKFPVLYYLSFQGIFYSLKAGVVIVSSGKQDVNELLINGAKII